MPGTIQRILLSGLGMLCLLLPFDAIHAQDKTFPILERKITLSAQNQTVEKVLDEISSQSGIIFSYSPGMIRADARVSLSLQDKSVRYAINSLFSDPVDYKVKGNYIILKGTAEKQKNVPERTLEGYVYDSGTGGNLSGVSIYNKDLTASAVTDQYGYFRMELNDNTPLASIQVSKVGYADTSWQAMEAKSLRTLEITMHSDDRRNRKSFHAMQKIAPLWLVPRQTLINSRNIEQSVFKSVQFSLLPSLSTNRFVGGNVVNHVSINLLAGYVQGVKGVEFGGLLNMVKEDARYAEFAGIGNVVGNQVKGVQVGGIFNTAREVNGVQLGGIFSYSVTRVDVQVSGIYNQTHTGFAQTSGLMSVARSMKWQLAGFANYARDTADIQVSGIINRAGYARTLQLSLINVADSSGGVCIGLFNFIKNGYHKLEYSADEVFPFNVSYRSGMKSFHTLVTIGYTPFKSTGSTFHYGYGVGSSFGKTGKLLVDIDMTFREVFSNKALSFNNHIYQVYAGIDKPLSPKISIAAGLTYNFLVYNTAQPEDARFATLPPYEISSMNFLNGKAGKTWFGARVALRF
jgi:hypothetical protein